MEDQGFDLSALIAAMSGPPVTIVTAEQLAGLSGLELPENAIGAAISNEAPRTLSVAFIGDDGAPVDRENPLAVTFDFDGNSYATGNSVEDLEAAYAASESSDRANAVEQMIQDKRAVAAELAEVA